MDLALIQKVAHQNSKDHGFWDGPEQDNIPTKIALIHEEASEALHCFRHGEMDLTYEYDESAELFSKPEGFGVELADIIIRVGDLAERLSIDLSSLVALKLGYNATRPHMHGRRV